MNNKEYLQQIEWLDELINEKLAEVDRLRCLATKVNCCQEGDRVKSSGSGDKIGNTVSKIVDLQYEINQQIDKFVDLKQEILGKIDSMHNRDYSAVLYKRYFEYKTFDRIADELNFSRRWVTTLHDRALDEFVQ